MFTRCNGFKLIRHNLGWRITDGKTGHEYHTEGTLEEAVNWCKNPRY